ncbi:hypothetical protein I317_05280 [Kwoniella heveanensis CBS 569]|nr:hypothetical protein I317_05280 [Kwoniella heveanensis CBS 569]
MQEDPTAPAGGQNAWPSAPAYKWACSPTTLTTLDTNDLEVRSGVRGNFWRSARWTPDPGSLDLTPKVFEQPDAIHSTLWYPLASAHSPETYCFVTSIRDTPVRLVDASDGRIRATYPIIDHRERFIAPHSLAFNPTASKLYCGFENAIEVFDVASPGYDTAERLKTVYARREKGGQKGIISAIAFCTDYSGTFAAGSFSGSVALYSEDTGSTPLAHVDGVKGGGVTQIAFHPLSPTTMFVASRRSSAIQVYDTRDLSAPVSELSRSGSTNQRISFDVDPWGRWISSGDEYGSLGVWDISDLASTSEPIFKERLHDGSDSETDSNSEVASNESSKDNVSGSESATRSNTASNIIPNGKPKSRYPSWAAWDAKLRVWSFAAPLDSAPGSASAIASVQELSLTAAAVSTAL